MQNAFTTGTLSYSQFWGFLDETGSPTLGASTSDEDDDAGYAFISSTQDPK